MAASGGTLSAYVLIMLFGGISTLQIVGVSIPTFADLRQPTTLVCSFDTERDHLFSVKWYKDDHEFFRYMPSNKPSVTTFKLVGATVLSTEEDSCTQDRCSIRLGNLTPSASGSYICEVSAEAPAFMTVMEARNMTVAALPLERPRIEGLRSSYDIGETLEISCRTAPSNPPSVPRFYVNDMQMDESLMNRSSVVDRHDDTVIGVADLRVELTKAHFMGGALLRIRCVAAVTRYPTVAQSTVVTAALAGSQTLRNQKLEWGATGAAGQLGHCRCAAYLAAMMLACYGWKSGLR